MTDRLVSPHGWDGHGPVPDEVQAAARTLAYLRTRFLTTPTTGMESPLSYAEVDDLFEAAATQAEWMREQHAAIHPDDQCDENEHKGLHTRVPFLANVVLCADGALWGIELTCQICGEKGWKRPEAMAEHARTHPATDDGPGRPVPRRRTAQRSDERYPGVDTSAPDDHGIIRGLP